MQVQDKSYTNKYFIWNIFLQYISLHRLLIIFAIVNYSRFIAFMKCCLWDEGFWSVNSLVLWILSYLSIANILHDAGKRGCLASSGDHVTNRWFLKVGAGVPILYGGLGDCLQLVKNSHVLGVQHLRVGHIVGIVRWRWGVVELCVVSSPSRKRFLVWVTTWGQVILTVSLRSVLERVFGRSCHICLGEKDIT